MSSSRTRARKASGKPGSSSAAGSVTVTRLPGHAALISPASSSPTGPAPSSSTCALAASASRTVWRRALAAALSSVSNFAGNGYPEPVASTV